MTKKNKKVLFKEKPTIKKNINTGIYIINTSFLKNFFARKKVSFVGMDEILSNAKKINVFNIGNKWIDIGHIEDFKRAFLMKSKIGRAVWIVLYLVEKKDEIENLNFLELEGKKLVEYSIIAALKTNIFNKIFIISDDKTSARKH